MSRGNEQAKFEVAERTCQTLLCVIAFIPRSRSHSQCAISLPRKNLRRDCADLA